MIYETGSGRCKELKLAYTNTEGLTSVRRDLEENEPHMIGLTETKLNEEIEVLNTGKRNRTDNYALYGTYPQNDFEILERRQLKEIENTC